MTYIPQIPIEDLVYIEFRKANRDGEWVNSQTIRKELLNACKDGNINKTKRLIVFDSTSGILQVKGTLWMVGKEYVLLKQNVHLPISSIIKVQ